MKKHCFLLLFTLLQAMLFAQKPAADFSAQQVSGCSPLVVNFQDISTGNPTSWQWDFGNGGTSTLQNPTAVYTTRGIYTVRLIATNNEGSDTITRTGFVTVFGKPKVGFSVASQDGCYPFKVAFTDTSEARPNTTNISWEWDFGNGIQSTQQSPQTVYTTAGDYTVSLKVTNDKGCFATVSRQAYIRIPSGLNVGFDNTPVNRCRTPLPVTFTNKTTGPGALTYAWDFGDGTTSGQQNVAHTYNAPGTYSVSLVVTSNRGCTDTLRKQNLITIQDIATSFKAPESICVSSPVSFVNTSTPNPRTVRWDFGDKTTSASVNPTKTFSTPGTYTVKLYNTYTYCTDSFAQNIQILPRPTANYSADITSQCQPPLTVRFKDASANAVSWQWDFGDGTRSTEQNPAHTYTAYGSYNVTLTVTNSVGCTAVLRRNAYVQIRRPVITFPTLPQNGCVPYAVRLSANVNTLDKVSSYLWNFGDGTTSTLATPTYTYNDQGSYAVTLTITTSSGCTETLKRDNMVVVGRKPVIDFTATPNPVCAYQNVLFGGTTNEGDKWEWKFGDSTTASEQNPLHAYKDTGRFSVTMTVTNNGCKETLTKPRFVQVNPPIAKFGIVKNCGQSNNIRFADSSIGAKSWFWNFGDSTTSTEQNPLHLFNKSGTYKVSLTVISDTCSNTFTLPVSIFEVSPSFTASTREACKTTVISYTALTQNAGDVTSYDWRFGNGKTSTEANPQVTYEATGDFTTTLITTDIYGCKDTIAQNNFIRINGPTAKFTATNKIGCKGLTALFPETSTTDGKNGIAERRWQYGDGQTETFGSRASFQHTYNDTGSFAVQLFVTDSAGCKDSLRIANLVKTSAPKASFVSADTLNCLGSTVKFTNRTTSSQTYTLQWSFGDSTFSADRNPSHLYKDTGSYDIVLKITDAYGCSDSVSLPRYINIHKTVADFSMSDSIGGCTPFNVRFTNSSTFFSSSFWRIGKDSSVQTNPVYSFSVEGTYPITLIAKGQGGCLDSAKKTVVIYSDSSIKFSYSPLIGCRPVLVSASINSPVNMKYTWDFGDGKLITTKSKDTTHLLTNIGDYTPSVIVSDSGNCLVPLTGIDTVRVKGVFTKFGWDKRLFCDSGTVQFLDSTRYNEPTTYNWNFGDGSSSSVQNPAHTYQQPGVYTVTLAAQTTSLCTDTTAYEALIKVSQTPRIAILGDSVFCANSTAIHSGTFLRRDTSVVQWFWQFPNGATASAMRPPAQRYTQAGDYEIKAFAVNSSGCQDSATKNIRINALPSVTLPSSLTSPVGVPIQIQPALYSPDVVSYSWTPATSLSCTNCPQPMAKPSFNTIYTVVAKNENGCQASAQVQVMVFCRNANVFVPNTFSPNGDGSNDVFYVRGQGLARVKSLRIFNRVGEVVFERQNFAANDESAGWDGTYKGSKLAPDTYIYQLEVFCENNIVIRTDGSITLIR